MNSMTASILRQYTSIVAALLYRLSHHPVLTAIPTAVLVGALSGCSRPLPLAEYQAYVSDPAHGLTHSREVNGAVVTCTYRPTPLLVEQDLAHISSTPFILDSLAQAYAGKTYCALTLARDGGEIENATITDPTDYQQTLTYLNSGIAADTYLTTSPRDSVPALASMYLRQYGTTGHSTILLVFDTSKLLPERGFKITLLGQRLGLGTVRFPFAARDLDALPELQID